MTVWEELKARGLIAQVTDEDEIKEMVNNGKATFYIGFDPTADSLHVGHFMALCLMKRLQEAGNKPIALIGGGTAMIGDPSGKYDMRTIMTKEKIDYNAKRFAEQLSRFISFDNDKAIIANNADWLLGFNYLEFIRDIGSRFSVNAMLRAECFKQRMDKGLSFLEFNYMLLQSYDFYALARDLDCKIEFGGNDQWSNILFGADLARRLLGKDNYYGMTFSLLTNSEGKKMGKTQKGALWLDADKTSPFEFYQYWRNVDDADVNKCLRMLTFLPMEEVERLSALEGAEINKAKEILAFEVTKLVHGEEAATKAQEGAKAAFSGGAALDNIPAVTMDKANFEGEGMGVVNLIREIGVVPTNSEGFRTIKQGGLEIAGSKVTDPKMMITADMFDDAGKLLVKKGKKTYRMVELG